MIGGTLAVVTAEFDGGAQLLLGEKQYGPDKGKLVLPGGKLMEEFTQPESPFLVEVEYAPYGAAREVEEETGALLPQAYTFQAGGIIVNKCVRYVGFDDVRDEFAVSLFRSRIPEGNALPKLQPSEELLPAWLPADALPYDRMQSDMTVWLPLLLDIERGDWLTGNITIDANSGALLEHELFFYRRGERPKLLPANE